MRGRVGRRVSALVSVPLLRRFGFHLRRLTGEVDRGFFLRLMLGLFTVVFVAALLVAGIEGPRADVGEFFSTLSASFYWAVTTVMGSGDASYVQTPAGYVVSWLLVLFGVAIVASITGALVGFVIDFLIKEGQGMGAAGYRDHIVVCGWNPTARELIAELGTDEYTTKIVVIHDRRQEPGRRRASTSSAATSPMPRTCAAPASRRRWPRSSVRPTPATRRTCARSSP